MKTSTRELAVASMRTVLLARFPDAREAAGWAVVLPGKHPGFGDIEVRLEEDIGLEVLLGRFTHAHFEFDVNQLGTDAPEEVRQTVEKVADLLGEVVGDRIVFFTAARVGGYYPRGRPGLLALIFGRRNAWLWSGPLDS